MSNPDHKYPAKDSRCDDPPQNALEATFGVELMDFVNIHSACRYGCQTIEQLSKLSKDHNVTYHVLQAALAVKQLDSVDSAVAALIADLPLEQQLDCAGCLGTLVTT